MKTSILLIMIVLLSGCSVPHSIEREVDAIYWHEGQRYTAKVENANIIVDYRIPPFYGAKQGAVTLYKDVDVGNKSWYKCEWTHSTLYGINTDAYCEIHIHSLEELGTAGWNHGKFGTGSTTRID